MSAGAEPGPDDVEDAIAGLEGMLSVEALRDEVRRMHLRATIAEARSASFEAITERARRAVKYAQMDGGRHALQSALDDHDGTGEWPAFLQQRLAALLKTMDAEWQVIARGR